MKKVVDISVFDGGTMEWKPGGSVILSETGAITFEGMNEKAIKDMHDHGAVGNGCDGVKYPRDGAAFLDALYLECNRCTMVRAILPDMNRKQNPQTPVVSGSADLYRKSGDGPSRKEGEQIGSHEGQSPPSHGENAD